MVIEQSANKLTAQLRSQQLRLISVESCTGGWVAEAMTALAGSSDIFSGGLVTYSNELKQKLVDVPEEMLSEHGAVSVEVAAQMVRGALHNYPAEAALSITGVAGPGGGTEAKPVGFVCFGWQQQGREPATESLRFDGDRKAVRQQAVVHALDGMVRYLST